VNENPNRSRRLLSAETSDLKVVDNVLRTIEGMSLQWIRIRTSDARLEVRRTPPAVESTSAEPPTLRSSTVRSPAVGLVTYLVEAGAQVAGSNIVAFVQMHDQRVSVCAGSAGTVLSLSATPGGFVEFGSSLLAIGEVGR
jgi:biotin carboxyl carrier protein